jgi:hypothetical protein
MLMVHQSNDDINTVYLTEWIHECQEDVALLTALILEGLKSVVIKRAMAG